MKNQIIILIALFGTFFLTQSCDNEDDVTPKTYYSEIEAMDSTTSNTITLQVHTTLTLPPGNYILTGYLEAYNSSHDAGVRAGLYQDSEELAYGIVYSNTSTFGSWSTVKEVNPTATTTYQLSWGSWPNGLSYIRRARLSAIEVQ